MTPTPTSGHRNDDTTVVLDHPLTTRTPDQIMNDLHQLIPDNDDDRLEELIGHVIDSVRDSYALALRTPELVLSQTTIDTIEATVADAVGNQWF